MLIDGLNIISTDISTSATTLWWTLRYSSRRLRCADKSSKMILLLTTRWVSSDYCIPLIKSRRVAYRSCNFRRTRLRQPSISSFAWETVTSPDFSFHAMLSDAWLELVLENMTKFFFVKDKSLQSWCTAVSQLGSKRYRLNACCTSTSTFDVTYPNLQITAVCSRYFMLTCIMRANGRTCMVTSTSTLHFPKPETLRFIFRRSEGTLDPEFGV